MPRRLTRLALLACVPAVLLPAAARADGPKDAAAKAEFFETRVRPVLHDHCVSCHGAKTARGGLRLDSREMLMKGSEAGPVVTPGDPEASPLVEAVRRTGPVQMPPKKPLDPKAVADLTEWVRLGAPWPDAPPAATAKPVSAPDGSEAWRDHWAFRPVRDVPAPAVRNGKWPRTSVDPFVLAAIEAKGLAPSPEADRRTLIRRVSADLIGLPPTPEEVEAFVNDRAPDAYERLVERLLASPHYGERWGRLWLDVARYSDTKGYVFFEDAAFPWAYSYRDYVVRALNDDVPYDRFVVEQVAADRLPTRPGEWPGRTLAALGFLSLGGRFMNNPHDIIDDRIDVVTRGLMGLTVACARCHDHKYDPVPSADYYALYGVFASTTEPDEPPLLDPPPNTPAYHSFEKELHSREAKLDAFIAGKRADLVTSAKSRVAEYLLAAQAARDRPNTEQFMLLADGNDLNPTMLIRWQAYLERTRRGHHPVFGPWHTMASWPAAEFPARVGSFCEELASRADPARPVNPLIARALAESPPASLADAAKIYAKVLNGVEPAVAEHLRREALNHAPPGPLPDPALEELRAVFHGPDAPPDLGPTTLSNLELLPDRPAQGKLQELEKAVETWRSTGPGAPPRAMSLVDLPRPVAARVFLRGNPNTPGRPVDRRFLSALSAPDAKPFAGGSGRLDLARAIASPDNPLTARVLVNRVWLNHTGNALVNTPGDFGLRSDPPTNPGLLDHLAWTFTHEDRWSLKALHRRVVLSAAYRQSSGERPDARKADPENALLWKMNRRRLDFEGLRDAILAVSGRLDRRVGGPPMDDVAAPAATRRTLYGKIDRLNLPGLYRTFDFPDPNATSPKRDATTVAPQALFLMNHPFALSASKALADRPDVKTRTESSERLARLYQLAYGRDPTPDERSQALSFINDPEGGWERFAGAVLMSNEFAFVD
ncbi:MAG: PSD1 and planctomycete cytochrome C domain-containing protein [Isosphaeraceae bacterium]